MDGLDRDELLDRLKADWEQHTRSPAQVEEELVLLRLRGLSIREIQRVSGVPRSTVGYRLKRGQQVVRRMLMNESESRRVADTILFMDSLVDEACRAIHEARPCSLDKLRALKAAANVTLSRYRIHRSLGLIRRPLDDLESLVKQIQRATLPELEAWRERLLRLLATA